MSETPRTDAEPVFLSIGSSELCQFVSGEWSLRDKLSNGDIVHVRYLVGFEVSLAAALAAMTAELATAKADRNTYDSAHKREAANVLRLTAELAECRKALEAAEAKQIQICCQDFDKCNERCWPLICKLRERIEKLESDIRIMVEKAADKSLAGYRELGAKCAALEERAEAADAKVKESESIICEHLRTVIDLQRQLVEAQSEMRERCAKEATNYGGGTDFWKMGNNIAKAIRALPLTDPLADSGKAIESATPAPTLRAEPSQDEENMTTFEIELRGGSANGKRMHLKAPSAALVLYKAGNDEFVPELYLPNGEFAEPGVEIWAHDNGKHDDLATSPAVDRHKPRA